MTQPYDVLGWLRTLILYRVLGGRTVLALTALGWLWRRISGGRGERRDEAAHREGRASASRSRVR